MKGKLTFTAAAMTMVLVTVAPVADAQVSDTDLL